MVCISLSQKLNREHNTTSRNYTVCPRNLDPIYRVTYYIKWVTVPRSSDFIFGQKTEIQKPDIPTILNFTW